MKNESSAKIFTEEESESSSLRRMRRGAPREKLVSEDDGEGNWLIAYADMMTLLLSFFVILSVFSTPDTAKLEKLKRETAKSMKVAYSNPYEDLATTLKNVLKDFNLDRDVTIEQKDDGLVLISKGTLFFDSGSSDLKPQAFQLVSKISDVLVKRAREFNVIVEGHTDDIPIVSKVFPSNWELSAARASTVVRLLESKSFPRTQLKPVGLADSEPVAPNRDGTGNPIENNQAQNRRIVIFIQKKLPKRVAAFYDPLSGTKENPLGRK